MFVDGAALGQRSRTRIDHCGDSCTGCNARCLYLEHYRDVGCTYEDFVGAVNGVLLTGSDANRPLLVLEGRCEQQEDESLITQEVIIKCNNLRTLDIG